MSESSAARSPEAIREYVLRLAAQLEPFERAAPKPLEDVYTPEQRERAERILPYRRFITDADFARVVRGELDTKAAVVVRRFLEAVRAGKDVRFCWLTGGTGIGKTCAAIAAIADLRGRVLPIEDVVRAFRNETDEARELREQIETTRLLVIDDVGTSDDREREKKALYQTINGRQGGRLLTILTSNLDRAEVETFDPRMLGRIRHQGAIVFLEGDDLRGGSRDAR